MTLRIHVESATISDEGININALNFRIMREVGTHLDEAARLLIPKDERESLLLRDVHINSRTLDLLTYDVDKDPELGWLKRPRQKALLQALWQVYKRISYCKHSPDDGFELLFDRDEHVIAPEILQQGEDVLRRRAIALLEIREPEIRFDMQDLRKQLSKNQKDWVHILTGE
ncbi:MAG: hypothetical protein K2Y22_14290 [Candidatus Obscuribacterales bacterium]|nr:hypothetical protein [Candidatus Obscuribacterales bacterium]